MKTITKFTTIVSAVLLAVSFGFTLPPKGGNPAGGKSGTAGAGKSGSSKTGASRGGSRPGTARGGNAGGARPGGNAGGNAGGRSGTRPRAGSGSSSGSRVTGSTGSHRPSTRRSGQPKNAARSGVSKSQAQRLSDGRYGSSPRPNRGHASTSGAAGGGRRPPHGNGAGRPGGSGGGGRPPARKGNNQGNGNNSVGDPYAYRPPAPPKNVANRARIEKRLAAKPTVRFSETTALPGGGKVTKITQPGGARPYASGERTPQLKRVIKSKGLHRGDKGRMLKTENGDVVTGAQLRSRLGASSRSSGKDNVSSGTPAANSGRRNGLDGKGMRPTPGGGGQ